jgi:hypothetical protein
MLNVSQFDVAQFNFAPLAKQKLVFKIGRDQTPKEIINYSILNHESDNYIG